MEIKSAMVRKQGSVDFLRSKGIPVFEHLPAIEENHEVTLRNVTEVACRAIALCIVAVRGECVGAGDMTPKEIGDLQNMITARFNADGFFTPKEMVFLLDDTKDTHSAIQFSWQYECLNVMLWALNFVDELTFPDDICDVSAVVRIIQSHETFGDFLAASSLRNKEEILDQADLIYRYNWACVDARINNRAMTTINPGVVAERHRALNWLIHYCEQPWDEVTTDT
ncbi:MAG: DUF4272 domain-containing protein [Defluviitaleaceae bacterium]|nr:DUF4272 domain-containing protein [Defluviitaleaceae bacterium]